MLERTTLAIVVSYFRRFARIDPARIERALIDQARIDLAPD
jgi:hypothetical protein